MMKGAEPIFIDNGSNIGILMIHGFSSTPSQFKELSAYLSDRGLNVYAMLVAGHGTKPEDLYNSSPEDWKQSVKEAYQKLKGISQKIIIIGNSFGSNLGLWLAKESGNEPIGIITLDAPIFLRRHWLVLLRLYTYGLLKRYYKKSRQMYQTDYIDMMDDVSYRVIPTKSLRDFARFINKETRPSLSFITVPALVTHSSTDPVIHPRSARYLWRHLGSPIKKIDWFVSDNHAFTVDGRRLDVFSKIVTFIQEAIDRDV